jgi:hypothetical protein
VDQSGLQIVMDVRAYREKPSAREAQKSTAQALWTYLQGVGSSQGLMRI